MLITVAGTGNLTANAEVKTTTENSKLVQFSIACNERVKENNEWKDRASFYTVKVWLHKDSKLTDYLVKGQSVQVSGSLVQERWEKDGNKQSMHVIRCQGDGIELVGGSKKEATGPAPTGNEPQTPPPAEAPAEAPGEDEIPF